MRHVRDHAKRFISARPSMPSGVRPVGYTLDAAAAEQIVVVMCDLQGAQPFAVEISDAREVLARSARTTGTAGTPLSPRVARSRSRASRRTRSSASARYATTRHRVTCHRSRTNARSESCRPRPLLPAHPRRRTEKHPVLTPDLLRRLGEGAQQAIDVADRARRRQPARRAHQQRLAPATSKPRAVSSRGSPLRTSSSR